MELPIGEFEVTIDDKGRIAIPDSLRDYSGDLVIMPGDKSCLCVMTSEAFETFRKAIDAITDLSLSRELKRQFIAQAKMADGESGHITIPSMLREWAGLSKNCILRSIDGKAEENSGGIFAGIPRLEIWDAKAYRESKTN